MMIDLTSGGAGAGCVNLTSATIIWIVSMMCMILDTISGKLGGVLGQVLRCVLRRQCASRGRR